jgi:hypothetical protein
VRRSSRLRRWLSTAVSFPGERPARRYTVGLIRIRDVVPLEGFRVRLILTNGEVVERDLSSLLFGPVFEAIRLSRGAG